MSMKPMGLALSLSMSILLWSGMPACQAQATFDECYKQGQVAFSTNDFDTAGDLFLKAKQIDPKDDRSRAYLARTYEAQHRFTEAEREFEDLIRTHPENVMWKHALADCYIKQSKYTSAISVFQECLGKNTNDISANYGMAICLESSQDLDSARDFYNKVIKLDAESAYGQDAEHRIARLNKAAGARDTNKFFPIDKDLGDSGLGWWDFSKPIHVYVDDGSALPGFNSQMKVKVYKALQAWSQASNGKLAFVIDGSDPLSETKWKEVEKERQVLSNVEHDQSKMPSDPIKSNMHVHWIEGGGHYLGLTWTSPLWYMHETRKNPVIRKVHMWIATNRMSDNKPLPSRLTPENTAIFDSHDRLMQYVILHEMGHALGLPHSFNADDVMVAGVYALNSLDSESEKTLSVRDVASLNEHYNDFSTSGAAYIIAAGPGIPPGMYEALEKQKEAQKQDSDTGGTGGSTDSSAGSSGGDSTTSGDSNKKDDGSKSGDAKKDDTKKDDKKSDSSKNDDDKDAKKDEHKFVFDKKDDKDKADKDKGDKKDDTASDDDDDKDKKADKQVKVGPYDPLKDAIWGIQNGHPKQSVEKLNEVLAKNPHHLQAHYLMAVAYVVMRKYPEAKLEYAEVLKLAPPNSQLAKMATDGLKKIGFN